MPRGKSRYGNLCPLEQFDATGFRKPFESFRLPVEALSQGFLLLLNLDSLHECTCRVNI
jgi:hypothetical protein